MEDASFMVKLAIAHMLNTVGAIVIYKNHSRTWFVKCGLIEDMMKIIASATIGPQLVQFMGFTRRVHDFQRTRFLTTGGPGGKEFDPNNAGMMTQDKLNKLF